MLTTEMEIGLRRFMDDRPADPAALAALKTRHQTMAGRLQDDFATAALRLRMGGAE